MQQPISRRGVYEPGMTARVAGRVLEVSGASVDRSLPDPVSGGSLRAASASFTAVEGPDVTDVVATPWDPGSQWPPVPESPASVSMDAGAGSVSLLRNGRVVSVAGGTSGRGIDFEAADAYQSFDKTITWDNLADAMPLPAEAEGDRYVGLQSVALTDRILRHCGWFSTPPELSYSLLSVPAMGTMWPETGRCDTSGRLSTNGGYPYWDATPWGVGVHDVEATYTLAGAAYTLEERNNIEFTAMTTDTATANRIDVRASTGAGMFRFMWSQTHGYIQVRGLGGGFDTVASVPRSDGLLYATVSFVSSSVVSATIRSGGASSTSTATVSNIATTWSPGDVTIRVNADSHASGFMVAMPAVGGALESWTPSVNMRMRRFNRNYLRAVKAIESVSCVELLQAQCEAEAATYWIDELGVLQWWDLARLEDEGSVATLTAADDIAEAGFSWSHELSSVKSRVLVKWQDLLVTRRWRTSVDLWQGSGETLQPNEVDVEEFLNVPEDEIWFGVDSSPLRIGTFGMDDFNNGVGSFYGAVISGSDGAADSWAQQNGSFLLGVERVTDSTYKMVTQWHGDKPAIQKTPGPETSSGLWYRRRDMDLPIIRGRARYQTVEKFTYSTQRGEPTAPEHEIDAGWWIQVPEQAEYTANYYGARVTVPQPVLSSVALIPIPGLQLGDVVDVQDDAITGLTIRGIIIEDARSIDDGMGMDHTVMIRPTYVTKDGVTWDEWAAIMDGRAWESWGANVQPMTWEQWGSDPLTGEGL